MEKEEVVLKYQNLLKKNYNLKSCKIKIESEDNTYNFKEDLTIEVVDGKNDIFHMRISEFPGCCGIAVVNNMRKYASELKDIGRLFFDFAVELCKSEDYGYVMITDTEGGYGESLMSKVKYKVQLIDEFKNPGSGNKVKVWAVNLKM